MPVDELQGWITLGAAALGLVGSLVLAFSLDRPVKMFRTHLEALGVSVESLAGESDVVVFTGFDKQHQKALAASTRAVKVGAILLALAFLAQAVSTMIPSLVGS